MIKTRDLSLGRCPGRAALSVVMSMTGHKKYEALKSYVRILDPAKREAIEKLK